MARPGEELSGDVCRYLWKFGAATARIQAYPLCKVEPAPEPDVVLPVVVVLEGDDVVLVGVLVVMVIVVVQAEAFELEDRVEEVVVRRVVAVVVGATPG